MTRLDVWQRRPVEEANLFNPPFLCALIYEFTKEFGKSRAGGAPLMLIVIALATSLHRMSRERLPYSTVTSLYEWLQGNEELLIGFGLRASNIAPHIKEAILFGLSLNVLKTGEGDGLLVGPTKASFSKGFLETTTPETRDIVYYTKYMGRWLSKSGSEISIVAAWGVKP